MNIERILKLGEERYSPDEKAQIQKVFKENYPKVYALHKLFWQLDLTDEDKRHLDFDADTLKLIKKIVLPDISDDVPLGQQADTTSDPLLDNLNQMNPALACIMMDANDIRVQYLDQQFKKLINGFDKEDGIVLKDLRKKLGVDQDELRHVNMLAYKALCKFIDKLAFTLVTFANPKEEETPEAKAKRLAKDSSK